MNGDGSTAKEKLRAVTVKFRTAAPFTMLTGCGITGPCDDLLATSSRRCARCSACANGDSSMEWSCTSPLVCAVAPRAANSSATAVKIALRIVFSPENEFFKQTLEQ